jgi:hypothetical protein
VCERSTGRDADYGQGGGSVFKLVRFWVALAMSAPVVLLTGAGPAGAAFPGVNGQIAFVSDRDGDNEIFVMNADGTAQTQITATFDGEFQPAWSPDGTKIAFMTDRDNFNLEVYVMNADGSGQTNLSQNAAFDFDPDWQALAPPTIEVEIDVKPGSDVNPVNLASKGVIPVAILTTPAFDALSVDPLSVAFGPAGAPEADGKGHAEDVDGDGDLDLLLHFRTQETGLTSADTEACVTGETFGGDAIEGCDAVTPK